MLLRDKKAVEDRVVGIGVDQCGRKALYSRLESVMRKVMIDFDVFDE
jgi:hypothetical protein